MSTTAPSSVHQERGRSNGLPFLFWLLERSRFSLVMIPTVFAVLVYGITRLWWAAVLGWVALPLFLVGLPLLALIAKSRSHDDGVADWSSWIRFVDPADQKRWHGKKIPMEVLYEAYMAERLEFTQDVLETLLRRNQLFRFSFTNNDIRFYIKDFLRQNTGHSQAEDHGDIAHVYNRGNDFYHWFLGDTMVYTSGIFEDPSESLEVGQRRKLDLVCRYVQLQPGDEHLDIGCGWGTLVSHAARHYGTNSTGVTLAQEQAEWAMDVARREGVEDRVRVIVDDYRQIPVAKYDKITCLEMAEHVGIKNFQQFLLQVRGLLKDDGIFYLQIAGLRRSWQYEDLVWGLFMGKYIFPGADASCPLGFVVNQCERAGWEVHRVENCGVHYSVTIKKWYENWRSNQEAIVAKYGQRWFRMWMVFLAWSSIIAAQGSSTVFLVTLTKNTKNDKESVSPEEAAKVPFSRLRRWIGPKPVATQQ